MKDINGKCKINISRVHSTHDNKGLGTNFVCISVQDVESGVQFLEVEMSLQEFAEGLMGSGHREGFFELRGADTVGKKYEHMQLDVKIPQKLRSHTDSKIKERLRKYLETKNPGWFPHVDDALNHHRAKANDVYQITYYRYV